MRRIFLLMITACAFALGACEEQKAGTWVGDNDLVRFYTSGIENQTLNTNVTVPVSVEGSTSTSVSLNPNVKEATAYYRIQAMGMPSDRPRTARIEQFTSEGQTMLVPVEGVNFEWDTEFTIPAGAFTCDIPIRVLRDMNAGTGIKSYRLEFRLVETTDLRVFPVASTAVFSWSQIVIPSEIL